MNELIKELKREAFLWCDDNIPEQFNEETMGYGGAWEDKFAELIVRECAQIALHNVGNISSFSDAEWVAEKIEDHFGVNQ